MLPEIEEKTYNRWRLRACGQRGVSLLIEGWESVCANAENDLDPMSGMQSSIWFGL